MRASAVWLGFQNELRAKMFKKHVSSKLSVRPNLLRPFGQSSQRVSRAFGSIYLNNITGHVSYVPPQSADSNSPLWPGLQRGQPYALYSPSFERLQERRDVCMKFFKDNRGPCVACFSVLERLQPCLWDYSDYRGEGCVYLRFALNRRITEKIVPRFLCSPVTEALQRATLLTFALN